MSNNFDIRRAIPAEFANGGYGNFETAQSISSAAAAGIDQNLLQHENPNRCSENDLAPRLPLEQYRLNIDQNPHVIRRKPQEKVQYLQEIAVRLVSTQQERHLLVCYFIYELLVRKGLWRNFYWLASRMICHVTPHTF